MTSLLFDHLTDKLLILSTIALTWYTAKAAHETARQVHNDDMRLMRMLIRKNKNARHAKRAKKLESAQPGQDNVWRVK